VPAADIREFCYEALAELRRDRSLGRGVLLATLHGAKGLEFPHVLVADCGWCAGQRREDERRLFYVGMTRARQTLTLDSVTGAGNPWIDEIEGDWLMRLRPQLAPPPPEVTARHYRLLSPADLDLGYAGRFAPDHRIHACLNALQTTDVLQARASDDRILLCNDVGFRVARLSRRGSDEWLPKLARIESVKIVAMLLRRQSDGDPAFAEGCRSASWEVPLVEVVTGG
jgi:ATP-dependent DNA helicase RecQ